MYRQFIKDSLLYSIATFMSKGVAILLVPFYTRVLTPAMYGIMDISQVFASFCMILCSCEIIQAVARFFADLSTEKEKAVHASTALQFVLVAFIGFGLLCAFFRDPLALLLFGRSGLETEFLITTGVVVSSGLLYVIQSVLRWDLKALPFSIASLGVVLGTTIVSVLLVLGLQMGARGVLIGQIAGNMLGVGISLGFSWRRYLERFSFHTLWAMLQFSLPLVPSSLAVITASYIDRISIRSMMTLSDLGVYGIASRFASIAGLLVAGVIGSLTPLVYKHHKEPETPEKIAVIFNAYVAFVSLFLIGFLFFSEEIFPFLIAREYFGAIPIVPLLVLSSALMNAYIFAPGLYIENKTKLVMVCSIIATMINSGLNLILVPRIGIVGAAIANLASGIAMFGTNFAFGQRYYPIRINVDLLAQYAFVVAFAWGLVLYLTQVARVDSDIWLITSKAVIFFLITVWFVTPMVRRLRSYLSSSRIK